MKRQFLIPNFAVVKMISEQALNPEIEVCGVLIGMKGVTDFVLPMENKADFPHLEYQFNPDEQINVMNKAAESGREIIGVYHSHVNAEAEPSQNDMRYAQVQYHYVILNKHSIRSFKIMDGVYYEEKIIIDY